MFLESKMKPFKNCITILKWYCHVKLASNVTLDFCTNSKFTQQSLTLQAYFFVHIHWGRQACMQVISVGFAAVLLEDEVHSYGYRCFLVLKWQLTTAASPAAQNLLQCDITGLQRVTAISSPRPPKGGGSAQQKTPQCAPHMD